MVVEVAGESNCTDCVGDVAEGVEGRMVSYVL